MTNPYEIMGVKLNVTESQLKKAFHKLARERHPDSDPNNPLANDEFKALSAAYELLSNSKRRALYDSGKISGDGTKRPSRREAKGSSKTHKRTYLKRKKNKPQPKASVKEKHNRNASINIKGTDVEYCLNVDFLDAASGGVQYISLADGKRLKVNIPPSSKDGLVLRLKGQGLKGIGGGEDGNAFVKVTINPDPIFRREENNVHVDLLVTLSIAVLGGKVEVPTIDGIVSVNVPKNSNTGTQLRLKEKGLGVKNRGDQFIHLKVVLPKKPDQEFIKFIKKWSTRKPYKTDKKDSKNILKS
jgi:DnaJ-class molecular chaperone